MCSVSYKIWGNWKSGLKKTIYSRWWEQMRQRPENRTWAMQLDLQSSHQLFTETASEIGGRGSRSQGNREKRLREVQQGVSTDICKARWRLDGGLKLSVSSDRIYEHRLKHHVIPCSPWQCSQKVYRLFFCLHIVCPFTFADVSINAFTYFPFF